MTSTATNSSVENAVFTTSVDSALVLFLGQGGNKVASITQLVDEALVKGTDLTASLSTAESTSSALKFRIRVADHFETVLTALVTPGQTPEIVFEPGMPSGWRKQMSMLFGSRLARFVTFSRDGIEVHPVKPDVLEMLSKAFDHNNEKI